MFVVYMQRTSQIEVGAEKKALTRHYNDLLWLHRVLSKNLEPGGYIVRVTNGVRGYIGPRRVVTFCRYLPCLPRPPDYLMPPL